MLSHATLTNFICFASFACHAHKFSSALHSFTCHAHKLHLLCLFRMPRSQILICFALFRMPRSQISSALHSFACHASRYAARARRPARRRTHLGTSSAGQRSYRHIYGSRKLFHNSTYHLRLQRLEAPYLRGTQGKLRHR